MILQNLIPPVFTNIYLKYFKPYGWFGNYKTWTSATKKSSGYDSNLILSKVANATEAVLKGEAKFEKDGILFQQEAFNWPVITHLLLASKSSQKIRIVDFGGSLGSIYLQHKKYLNEIPHLWCVVEQKQFVDLGKKQFSTPSLQFFSTTEEALSLNKLDSNILLIACVLQYLENPYDILANLISLNFEYIILDRLAFTNNDSDRITIQKVSPKIYRASYPSWFFSKTKIKSLIEKQYNLVCEYDCEDKPNISGYFAGLVYKKK